MELKIYGDNPSYMAIAAKDGIGRVKHLDGRLLWIQQRQGRNFQLRRLDTTTNPADLGTKALPGKRIHLLMFLLGFTNAWEDLGAHEFEDEKVKKSSKE